jgi:hypothetical protein
MTVNGTRSLQLLYLRNVYRKVIPDSATDNSIMVLTLPVICFTITLCLAQILKMGAIDTSEIYTHLQPTTRHYVPQDRNPNKYRCEELRSCTFIVICSGCKWKVHTDLRHMLKQENVSVLACVWRDCCVHELQLREYNANTSSCWTRIVCC